MIWNPAGIVDSTSRAGTRRTNSRSGSIVICRPPRLAPTTGDWRPSTSTGLSGTSHLLRFRRDVLREERPAFGLLLRRGLDSERRGRAGVLHRHAVFALAHSFASFRRRRRYS